MFKLPGDTNNWIQENKGDRSGNIVGSFGINLNEEGKIKIGHKFLKNISSTDDTDFGFPWAIIYNSELGWQVGAGSNWFQGGDLPNEAFTQGVSTSQPSFGNNQRPDLRVFPRSNGDIHTAAIGGSALKILAIDGTSWVDSTLSAGSGAGAPLIYFPATGRLYYRLSKSSMGSIDSPVSPTPVAPTATFALALNDNSQSIQCGTNTRKFIYLGTIADVGQQAVVHEWNGSSTAVSNTIVVDAQAVLAMCVMDDTPFLMDSNGVLRQFNGAIFVEVARLPLKKGKRLKAVSEANQNSNLLIHYNGMQVDGDVIKMNLNPVYVDGTQDELCPAGKWEFSFKNGLRHVGSSSGDKAADDHTGHADVKISKVGALAIAKISDVDNNGDCLIGVTRYKDATNTESALLYNDTNDTKQKAGSFITPRFYSNSIKDNFNKFILFLRKLQDSDSKVVVKYRIEEIDSTEFTADIANNSLSTSTNLLGKEGWEVEILQGKGAGKCAHITSVVLGATNYLVTLDEEFENATGTVVARLSDWKKIGVLDDQNTDIKEIALLKPRATKWIQFKVWFQSTGDDEINEIMVINNILQEAK